MKNKFLICAFVSIILASCSNDNIQYVSLGDKMVDSRLVKSGYYLTTATMSEIQLKDALDRIELIEKPNPLGDIKMQEVSEITINEPELPEITTKNIEAYIEQKRDRAVSYRTVKEKRGVKMGDRVVVDYEGTIDGMPFDGSSAENQKIVIGDGGYIEGFESQILGHKVQERFRITVNFPYDVEKEELRGKTAIFYITIRYIEEKYTPEVDYDFITKYSRIGATTSEAYREEIKKDLEFRSEYARNESIKNKLLNYLLNEVEATPSEVGVAWKMTKILTEQKRLAYIQGMGILEFLKMTISDINLIMQELKLSATYTIREDMILDELEKRYDVKMEDNDMEDWYNDIALYNDYGKDVSYALYKQSMGDVYVYDNARKSKILNQAIKDLKIISEE